MTHSRLAREDLVLEHRELREDLDEFEFYSMVVPGVVERF